MAEATFRPWTWDQRRQWTPEQETRSAARAAHAFLNMVRCSDCGLPWPEGYIHFECPALTPAPADCHICHRPLTGDDWRTFDDNGRIFAVCGVCQDKGDS